jgi:putative ABC transport system substrate-binding protein
MKILVTGATGFIGGAVARIRSESAGGILVLRDPLFFGQRTQIAALAVKSRLPAVYSFGEAAEAGGLMAYGASAPFMYRSAATYVDKILRGAKPADLPVEQPTKFELVINLKTAKALGLTIPPSLLLRADQVIE